MLNFSVERETNRGSRKNLGEKGRMLAFYEK